MSRNRSSSTVVHATFICDPDTEYSFVDDVSWLVVHQLQPPTFAAAAPAGTVVLSWISDFTVVVQFHPTTTASAVDDFQFRLRISFQSSRLDAAWSVWIVVGVFDVAIISISMFHRGLFKHVCSLTQSVVQSLFAHCNIWNISERTSTDSMLCGGRCGYCGWQSVWFPAVASPSSTDIIICMYYA